MTLTDASDKNAEQKQQFVDKTMEEAETLEKELREELKANLETRAFIIHITCKYQCNFSECPSATSARN